MPRLGVAVVGAGYWGPNLRPQLPAAPRLPAALAVRPRRGPGPRGARPLQHRRAPRPRWPTSWPTRRSTRVAVATPAGTHLDVGDGGARGRQARAGGEAAGGHLRRGPGAGRRRGRAPRPRAHVRPHLLLHAGGARRSASWCTAGVLGDVQYVDSVRINLGLVQRDIDVLWDLAPHDLSILDLILPDGVRPLAGGRARRGPDRRRPGLHRVPDAAAARRRDRARARQLAVPDQGPHDDRRRLQADARLGRPQPDPAAQRLRPRRRPDRRARSSAPTSGGKRWCHTARGDMVAPALPEREALRRRRGRVRRVDPRPAARRSPTAGPACGCSTSSRRPRQSLECSGAVVPLRELR